MAPASLEGVDGIPFTSAIAPEKPDEVAAVLARATEQRTPVAATGGGTKLHWGNVPDAVGLVRLDLSRLEARLAVDADEGIATVSAAVRVDEIERAARAEGKRTRLPSLHAGATLGGTIAADPISTRASLDGRLRNDLLGLQVALPNGTLTRSGGRVVKNVTGFDLVRLYCGSLGTLGVITEATLRLWPTPEEGGVCERRFSGLDSAIETARSIEARGVDPRGVALLATADGYRLLWRLEGTKADVDERATRVVGDRLEESVWGDVEAEFGRPRVGDRGRARVRVYGRPSDTLGLCEALAEQGGQLAAALPAQGLIVGELAVRRCDELFDACRARAWGVFVEHAEPREKERLDVFGPTPSSIGLMRAVKQRFDPGRILAPGRFVGKL